MFDFGFWELVVIFVIALIVLGPERLPVVARTLGKWVGRARQYANALTSELENEMSAADIRRDVREARERIEAETQDITDGAQRAVDSLNEPVDDSPVGDSEEIDDEALEHERVAVAETDEADDNRIDTAAGKENRQ